jgi:hypothetical protein
VSKLPNDSDHPVFNLIISIAEEERGFLGTVARQAFRTHRGFRAVIMDQAGTPVLWVSVNFYCQLRVSVSECFLDKQAIFVDKLSSFRST